MLRCVTIPYVKLRCDMLSYVSFTLCNVRDLVMCLVLRFYDLNKGQVCLSPDIVAGFALRHFVANSCFKCLGFWIYSYTLFYLTIIYLQTSSEL